MIVGMTLLMVEHPSGYGFKSFKDENDEVQRQESDGEKTTLYYNNMQDERNVIVCLQYIQQVANPKPIFVSVQDYYQSNLQSDTKVELTSRQVHGCILYTVHRISFRMSLPVIYVDVLARINVPRSSKIHAQLNQSQSKTTSTVRLLITIDYALFIL